MSEVKTAMKVRCRFIVAFHVDQIHDQNKDSLTSTTLRVSRLASNSPKLHFNSLLSLFYPKFMLQIRHHLPKFHLRP